MDKKLELRLIEEGYNPINAKGISLKDAGEIIKDEIYNNSKTGERPAGMILFDGNTQAIIRTGIGHSIIKKSCLAIGSGDIGRGGLYIHAPQEKENINNQRSSVYMEEGESSFVFIPKRGEYLSKNGLDLIIKSQNEMKDLAKIELFKFDDGKIFYLSPITDIQKDKLFWEHIGREFNLKLNEIAPQYTDKSPLTPWYSAKDKNTGINLTLGTRFRVYAVESEFPVKKSSEELKHIVEYLDVNPQTVDGRWDPKFSSAGKVCETHINKGRGDQVLEYMSNLLNRKE